MPFPPTDGLRVERYAEGGGFAPYEWARALGRVDWERDAGVLKRGHAGSVWRVTLALPKRRVEAVIKCQPIDSPKRRLQRWLRRTRAHRQWRGAMLLQEAGFEAAQARAIVRGTRDGVEHECLIMDALPGKSVLEHLADRDLGPRTEHRLAAGLGWLAGAMVARNIRNRDQKASNVMVLALPPAQARLRHGVAPEWLAQVDTEGVRPGRSDPLDALFSLLVECVGVGLTPRRALLMRALTTLVRHEEAGAGGPVDRASHRRAIREAWAEVGARLRAHGDPTPKDNPLPGSRPGVDGL